LLKNPYWDLISTNCLSSMCLQIPLGKIHAR
jgi:hypothetical protein